MQKSVNHTRQGQELCGQQYGMPTLEADGLPLAVYKLGAFK